jgi:hypothetical protein
LLFNVFINGIVNKEKESDFGIRIGDVISVLLFADDMVLIANSQVELSQLVAKVKEFCNKWHLEVNVSKTKVMVVSKDGREQAKVLYRQAELECVPKFSYLGMVFSADGKWKQEIDRMMQAGSAALSSVSKHVLWNKNISTNVKKIVKKAMVKSKMMDGSEV